MTDRTYFIYLHVRKDTGQVFYVGKGTKTVKKQYERAYITDKRNPFWQAIAKKVGYQVVVFAEFFTEDDAFSMERSLIAEYKLTRDGGSLCNLTLGGEGCSGINPSQETRKKLSIMASKPRSNAWVTSIRKARKNGGNSGVVKLGDKLPEQWRKNIALKKIGALNPMHGVTGGKHPMSRPVIHINAGVFFDSVEDAANHYGYKMKTLYNWLSGHRLNPTALEFA